MAYSFWHHRTKFPPESTAAHVEDELARLSERTWELEALNHRFLRTCRDTADRILELQEESLQLKANQRRLETRLEELGLARERKKHDVIIREFLTAPDKVVAGFGNADVTSSLALQILIQHGIFDNVSFKNL